MRHTSKWFGVLAILTILAMVVAACGAHPHQVIKETVVVTQPPEVIKKPSSSPSRRGDQGP